MNYCEPVNGIHVIPRGSQLCTCGQSSRTVLDVRAFVAWKNVGEDLPVGTVEPAELPAEAAPAGAAAAENPEAPTADSAAPSGDAAPAPKEGRRKRAR
jgi:hypothetical protein